MSNHADLAARTAVATLAIAACLAVAAPAQADGTELGTVGTPTAVVEVFAAPEPFTPSETLNLGPSTAAVNTVTLEGVVTYRGHVRRAIYRDGVVYLARNGLRLGPRAAATFRIR